jgi:hypothetical protein
MLLGFKGTSPSRKTEKKKKKRSTKESTSQEVPGPVSKLVCKSRCHTRPHKLSPPTPVAPKSSLMWTSERNELVEMFADNVSKSAENFRALYTGEKGTGSTTRKSLHFIGCLFHCIIKKIMTQSRDLSTQNRQMKKAFIVNNLKVKVSIINAIRRVC